MFTHKDVLVEQIEKPMSFKSNPLPVCLNFNTDKIIGRATCRYDGNKLFADIELTVYVKDLYPAIAYIPATDKDPGHIICIGLCNFPNLDASIKPLQNVK